MNKGNYALILIVFLMPLLIISCTAPGKIQMQESKHESNHSMKLHHLHSMMNHGLIMATDGSNMIMTSYMKMAPSVDTIGHDHGHKMMDMGKSVINQSLSGSEMMSMMKAGEAMSSQMKFTHELGEELLKLVDLLEKMNKIGTIPADMMEMHHQHGLINHALAMAAEGSNMKMLGDMDMTANVDNFSVDHGKMMLRNAKSLIDEVMSGESMMAMHTSGKTPATDAAMRETHEQGEIALKIIDLLQKMPSM